MSLASNQERLGNHFLGLEWGCIGVPIKGLVQRVSSCLSFYWNLI